MAPRTVAEKAADLSPASSPAPESPIRGAYYGETNVTQRSLPARIWDGFKRDPNASTTPKGAVGANGKVFDLEGAAHATANTALHRRLKGRHLQMIAIGGSIGIPSLYS